MAISNNDIGSLALDSQSLDKLRLQAKETPDKALKGAAQQFEQVFLNMMLKSMREATPQEGMFDNDQTKMFTGMLDQQLSQSMSTGRGVGLADIMVRQLSHNSTNAGGVPAVDQVYVRLASPLASAPSTERAVVVPVTVVGLADAAVAIVG